jgi:hypothetical protein
METEAERHNDPTFVERWLHDQQQWQQTLLTFLDSAVKNDDFLVHLGNALRGSLLAGKPYPMAAPPGMSAHGAPFDARLDQVLLLIHQVLGQMQDVLTTLHEMRGTREGRSSEPPPPTATAPGRSAPESSADDALDRVLFALHQLEGQAQDLSMTADEVRKGLAAQAATDRPLVRPGKASRAKRAGTRSTRPSKTRKRRVVE